MFKQLLFFSILILAISASLFAQTTLVEYNIRNLNPWNGGAVSASTVVSNVTASTLTVTGPAAYDTDYWAGSNENMFLSGWGNSFNSSQNYYQFTVSAATGHELDLSSISVGVAREVTQNFRGAQTYRLHSNLTGYTEGTQIASVTLPPFDSNTPPIDQAVLSASLGATFEGVSSVTFRIYGFGDQVGFGGGGLANFSGNFTFKSSSFTVSGTSSNVIVQGTVVALPVLPTVTTTAAASITATSATLGGNVTNAGNATITERGIVWGLSANPTVSNNKITIGAGAGSFSSTVSLLPMGTTIHVRSFATNSVGTAYGSNVSFTSTNSLSRNLTGSEGYRLLSAPVSTNYSTLLGPIWTQGIPGADSETNSPNVFSWATSNGSDASTNWNPISNLSNTISAGTGFLVYVYSDDNFDGNPDGFPKTLSVTGSEHASGVQPAINSNANGWTLLGNPFASTISFASLSTSQLTGIVYVWDVNDDTGIGNTGPGSAGAGSWKTYDLGSGLGDITGGLIAPFQGFFVQTNASPTTPSVNFQQAAKNSGGEYYGKEQAIEMLRFQLTGATSKNSAWLRFSGEGSFDYTLGDAHKLTPLSVNYALLATGKSDGRRFDIAHLPVPGTGFEVPLFVEASTSGDFTLSVTDFQRESGLPLYLIDREEQLSLEIKEDFSYSFYLEASDKNAKSIPDIIISPELSSQNGDGTLSRFYLATVPLSAENGGQLPSEIRLEQNYPNPFNPTTVIRYTTPENGHLSLKVYDLLGREIAVLVNGNVSAGTHEASFDASSLSSGMYVYRLESGGMTLTRKMTMLK